jgi:hypothetical protein
MPPASEHDQVAEHQRDGGQDEVEQRTVEHRGRMAGAGLRKFEGGTSVALASGGMGRMVPAVNQPGRP